MSVFVLVAAVVAAGLASLAAWARLLGPQRLAVSTVLGAAALAGGLELLAIRHADGQWVLAVAWGVFAAVLTVQVVIDLRTRTLPRQLSHAGLVAVVVLLVIGDARGDWPHVMLGAVSMTAITAALVLISRGSLGRGDLHLSPLLGAAIGWYAPSLVLVAWTIAAISAAGMVLLLLATARISRRSRIPYGPFLALGTLAAIGVGAIR